jgi:redox-sensitive bicupin YhaK (pirin superfamily)
MMETLTFEQLPQGGFAGLIERRFVTDTRVFKTSAAQSTFNGIGNFVYLADANFLPHGETTMHPHKEIDVISVMAKGKIAHEGSLEHGQSLSEGQAQVQRAGAEGFSHNELNPDDEQNQLIQLWVLPDQAGEKAGYKVYEPVEGQLTKIYGGSKDQNDTFYSQTAIYVANGKAGQTFALSGPTMAYVSKGHGQMNDQTIVTRTMARSEQGLSFTAESDCQIIFIQ